MDETINKTLRKSAIESNCTYCERNPANNSEHVFPKSLGGENIYMDCVCNQCNNNFSKIERELFQKSFIGLMRSSEGLEGYSKNKKRKAPLKYPEIFQFDKENKIVYEVGIHDGFKPYMRPQLIQVGNKIYSEAPTREDIETFIKAFNDWRKDNLTMITKFPSKKGENYKAAKFSLEDEKYVFEEIEISKVKKEVIHYTLMKDNDKYKNHFEPRMFFDDSGKLNVRSRKVEEGLKFVVKLLNYCNQEAANFQSYSEKSTKDAIRVSLKFDVVMMQQALVKIGLNALMHYHPETKYHPLLKPAKDYILKKTSLKTAIDKKIDLFDTKNDMHLVIFYQLKEGLMVRTSLFGGQFTYSFLVELLNLFPKHGHFSGLEVDYKMAKQKHYEMKEFILNRVSDMESLKN